MCFTVGLKLIDEGAGSKNTITDGGSTATHSKAISGLDNWMDPT